MSDTAGESRPEVFISHASCDRKAIEILTDLIVGIGGDSIDVFCTSSPGFDIPAGAEFSQYIQQVLKRSILIIQFITPAFLRSDFCILEAGAAWAQEKSFPILAPSLTINDVQGSPLASLQLVTMASGDGLDKLRDRMSDLLERRFPTAGWAARRDRAISQISDALGQSKQSAVKRMAGVGVRGRRLELLALSLDGRLSHSWWPRDDEKPFWNKPQDFQAPGGLVDLAVASRDPNHTVVFAIDNRGVLWQRWRSPSGWSGWNVFDKRPVAPPLAACSLRDGHLEVFAVDAVANSVIHRWSDKLDHWSEWMPLDEGIEPA